MNFKIVFEHHDWLVINKSAGISFHSENVNDTGELGVIEMLRHQLNTRELWPVHRLDKLTSGLLLVAKSKEAAAQLSDMFAKHAVQKFYLALIDQKPKKKQGWVIGDMGPSRRGAHKLLKTKENPAITQFFSASIGEKKRLCLLKPHSGKTHQLRVALKSLSAPILGDALYGGSQSDRMYLHAYGLDFVYDQQHFQITDLPENGEIWSRLAELLADQAWDHPWSLDWPSRG